MRKSLILIFERAVKRMQCVLRTLIEKYSLFSKEESEAIGEDLAYSDYRIVDLGLSR